MFRRSSKKRPAQLRKKREEDDEEDDENVKAKIQSTKKKLKLMSSLPLVTGEYSASSSRLSSNKAVNPLVDGAQTNGELSVLDKKHQEAMQSYIEEELNKNGDGTNQNDTTENDDKDKPATDVDTLYQELAKELYTGENKSNNNTQSEQEERGAVLVGGTGLAEVILPSSFSSKNQNSNSNRVYRKDIASSAVPSNAPVNLSVAAAPLMRSMMRNNHKKEQQQAKAKAAAEELSKTEKLSKEEGDGDDRVGFAAYLGKPQEKKKVSKKQRDDHVFSDFMKHQRQKFLSRR